MMSRILRALGRRLRLYYLRLRFPRARFGSRCDIRPGLSLLIGRKACLAVGSRCVLDRAMTIECHGRLTIGDRVVFGHHCTLAALEEVIIGDYCMIAEQVSIRDHDHCFEGAGPVCHQGFKVAPVHIGKNVWIGAKATITRGVTIGDNAVIGANAVVTKDIPAQAVAVGVPARVIRTHEGGVRE